MPYSVRISHSSGSGGRGWRISGGPTALVLSVLALLFLALFFTTAARFTLHAYTAYEGRLQAVESRWTDFLAFEFGECEHLIIETPEGKTIDRMVGLHTRISRGIRPGDYVVKEKGFGNRVRPRDRMTPQEMIDAHGRSKEGR